MESGSRRTATPIGEMWLEDGVLFHRLESALVSAEQAVEVRRLVAEITGGRPAPAVIDMRAVAFATRDARRAFAQSPEDSLETATALIVSTTSSETMARVFTDVDKPARPVAIFTSEADAVAWAKSHLDS